MNSGHPDTLLARVLPPEVVTAERSAEAPAEPAPADDLAAIARAVPKRRREFLAGRACAREALAALGSPPALIGVGTHGEPRWPAGVVGSITHCEGYRAAAVARAREVHSVGIDAEPHEPLPAGVFDVVATAPDRAGLMALTTQRPDVRGDRLLFCMKEAVYKAWFPLTGRWLGFDDAAISVDGALGTFVAELLVPGPVVEGRVLTEFVGRWTVACGLVVAAVVVPAAGDKSGRRR